MTRRHAAALFLAVFAPGCFGSTSGGPTDDAGSKADISLSVSSLTASRTSEVFGTTAVGSSTAPMQVIITNTGTAMSGALLTNITGTDATSFAFDSNTCSEASIGAGKTCTIQVHFAPLSAGAKDAKLSVGTPGGTPLQMNLSGSGAPSGSLTVTPTMQDFGSQATGASSNAIAFTFANTGTAVTDALSAGLSGAEAADFQITADACSGKTLDAQAECVVSVVFAPTATGSMTASLAVSADGATASASLSGTGVAPAAFSLMPPGFDFGDILTGTPTAPKTFTVQNTGGVASDVPMVGVSGPNAVDFAVSANTCTSALGAGDMCTFNVVFTPSTTVAESATLVVAGTTTTSASGPLTGTGLAVASISLNPPSEPFGSFVPGMTSPTTTFTLTNTGGVTTGPLAVSLAGTNAGQFKLTADMCTNAAVAAMGKCTVGVFFAPTTGTSGPVQASLTITGTPGGTVAATLTGTALKPAALTITPPAGFTGFGNVVVGNAPSALFTVTNGGGAVSGTITLSVSGSAEYSLANNTCTGTLQPTKTCTVDVVFKPTGGGSAPGQLKAAATPGGPATYGLTGSGETPAALAITPPAGFAATNGFGSLNLGNKAAAFQFTLTNSGSQTAGTPTISSNNPQFAISASTCTGPLTSSCTFDVTFTPAAPFGTDDVTLTATASPGGTANYSNSGMGLEVVLSVSPTSWLSQMKACSTVTQDFTITNTGNAPTAGALVESLTGMQTGLFTATPPACATMALGAGSSCVFPVTFDCTGMGGEGIGTLGVSSGAASVTAPLDVAAGVVLNPDPATFGGAVAPGGSVTQTFTLTNYTGVTTAFISGFSFGGGFPAEYTISSDGTCYSPTAPAPVSLGPTAPGNSCTFSVKFSAPVGIAGPLPATLNVECPGTVAACILASTVLDGSVQ